MMDSRGDNHVEIHFVGVAKQFGTRRVFDDVDLHLASPAIIGLIGDNGAGKTTLLRLTAGLYHASAGEVRVFGRPATREDLATAGRMGTLIEKAGYYDELTVRENLDFYYAFYRGERPDEGDAVDDALRRFGLDGVAGEPAGRLSSGYRQRLGLARALHPWADIILLDEPFESLDPRSRAMVKNVLLEMRAKGKLVLFSSHGLADVQQICDEVLVLASGRLFRFRDFEEVRRYIGEPQGPEDLDTVYARLAERLILEGVKRPCAPSA